MREGLRALLDLVDDIEVSGEADDGEAGLALLAENHPEVVLLDYRLPKLDGLGVLARLQEWDNPPAVIILTTFDDDRVTLEAIRGGAKGFLLKDVSLEELTSAIRDVARGMTRFKPAITERVLKGLERLSSDFPSLDQPDPLTQREVEILRLLGGGYSNREIAEALSVAEGTVKNHISSILSKLGVRDRTRAVLKAVEIGYLG